MANKNNVVIVANDNDRDKYNAKPPVFSREKFKYWKNKIENYFMAYDFDLWDTVVDGYSHPVDERVVKMARSDITIDQKKAYKNHFKARSIMLSAISYNKYEKITDKETAKSIFDSLQMNHEGNAQVRETKALALIQKYEAFKMEDDDTIEEMFSRFQTLAAGLRVLDKEYSTTDHVKKIIRSLPKKWRPMVTALIVSKDLNSTSLEELISSLRSHEIQLLEDEPQRKAKFVALRRLGQLWKNKINKFRRPRRTRDITELSGLRKATGNEVTCFECKEPGHYINDCPKLKKDKKPKKDFKGRKGLMETWDDSESEDEASDEEHANMALMAGASGYVSESGQITDDESDSDDEAEVMASLSRSKLEFCFSEAMKRYQLLKSDHKILKRKFEITSEAFTKKEKLIYDLNEKLLTLEKSNHALVSKISKLEEDIISGTSVTDEVIRYDRTS
ncbi:uncharacterized protein LOC131614855 [Vicia villosa]|uniref:uncharacterized protein LOC131614855 n=1 Tax=Vicia villosa TaxID=3911 RepID=UPI00273ACA06|nr:uncharacterized protein LOC131614855 [Vicia villosa]